MYALNCEKDLTHDGVPDCVAAGRFGAFLAIDSRDGSTIWTFDPAKRMSCTDYLFNLILSFDLYKFTNSFHKLAVSHSSFHFCLLSLLTMIMCFVNIFLILVHIYALKFWCIYALKLF